MRGRATLDAQSAIVLCKVSLAYNGQFVPPKRSNKRKQETVDSIVTVVATKLTKMLVCPILKLFYSFLRSLIIECNFGKHASPTGTPHHTASSMISYSRNLMMPANSPWKVMRTRTDSKRYDMNSFVYDDMFLLGIEMPGWTSRDIAEQAKTPRGTLWEFLQLNYIYW